MPSESFTIEKRNQSPFILARPMFMEWFRGFPEGQRFSMEIKPIKPNRSNQQNSYYWKVIVESFRHGALEEWGEYMGKEEAHNTLKANCLYTEKVNEETGEVFRFIGSTTDNDTSDQEVYHEKCRQLIYNAFNIVVPLPNEGQVEMFK